LNRNDDITITLDDVMSLTMFMAHN